VLKCALLRLLKVIFFKRKSKFKNDNASKLPFSQKEQMVILALKAYILTRKNMVK